ncbi:MAG: hypothetical protein HUJ51_04015 [Eggerthellaceae bacterium]|nr:hypothetical protein [Eggerthellaceae bacterium]
MDRENCCLHAEGVINAAQLHLFAYCVYMNIVVVFRLISVNSCSETTPPLKSSTCLPSTSRTIARRKTKAPPDASAEDGKNAKLCANDVFHGILQRTLHVVVQHGA